MNRKAQTDRLLRANLQPAHHDHWHMTGRQLLRRPGYDIDVERCCGLRQISGRRGNQRASIAARPGLALAPGRAQSDCMMSINPDAHSIRELDHMHWGVEMARKGGRAGSGGA
jgi:DNA polymerase (family 10)